MASIRARLNFAKTSVTLVCNFIFLAWKRPEMSAKTSDWRSKNKLFSKAPDMEMLKEG